MGSFGSEFLSQTVHAADSGSAGQHSRVSTQSAIAGSNAVAAAPLDPLTPSSITQSTNAVIAERSGLPRQPESQPEYLAVGFSSGGFYKTLAEIDVSSMRSDIEAFLAIKKAYRAAKRSRLRLNWLIKPVDVEFIYVSSSLLPGWRRC